MKRMGMLIAGLLMMVLGGGVVYIKANLETITQTIAATVESATGQPLVLEDRPSLSIFPQLGLSMDAGRWGNPAQDALSVTFQGAVVRVSLMGLLQRRIEFTELVLDAPHVVYREAVPAPSGQSGQPAGSGKPVPDAAGASGYILGRTAGSADRPTPQGIDVSRLALDSIRISGGEVTIEQGGTRTQLRQVAVQVDNLAPGKQGHMQVSLQLSTDPVAPAAASVASTPAPAATGTRAAPMTVDMALSSRFELISPVLRLQDVDVSLKPVTGFASAPIQVRGSMDVDTALLTLGALNLTAQLADLQAKLAGHMALADMSGQLELRMSGALRGALAAAGLLPVTADPAAFSSFDAHAMLKLGTTQVTLSELSGTLDSTTFSGELIGTLPAGTAGQPGATPLGLRGGLRIGALTVDKYLPAPGAGVAAPAPATPATPAAGPAKPASASAARAGAYPDVHLECSFEQLVVKKVLVRTLVTVLDGTQGQYALKPCTFGLYDAKAEASAQVGLPDASWALTFKASGINAGALLKDAAGTSAVSGRATVQAQLRSKGEGAAMTRNLNGKITLNAQLAVEAGLIPSEWSALMREMRTINMDNVDVVATITDGQVLLRPIQAKGKLLKAEGQGVIDLPADTMDVQVNATLAGIPLPLVMQGSLSKPRYGINPAGLIKGLLNAPHDGAKDLEQGLKSLFKKL